jgi:hypothetical protein
MTQLQASALTMVNAPAEHVLAVLSDYHEVRPYLLPDEFGDYEVLSGGVGAGTEVRWTMALDSVLRNKKGKRPKPPKRPPWDCLVEVSTPEPERIVERDTRSSLVATWVLRSSEDDERTAIRVDVTWEQTGGMFARQREQLALRTLYETLLTNLHEYFEPDPDEDDEDPDTEDATTGDAEESPTEATGSGEESTGSGEDGGGDGPAAR